MLFLICHSAPALSVAIRVCSFFEMFILGVLLLCNDLLRISSIG